MNNSFPIVVENSKYELKKRLLYNVLILAGIALLTFFAFVGDNYNGHFIAFTIGALIVSPLIINALVRCIKLLLLNGPQIVINDDGVFDNSLGVGLIPWESITGAELVTGPTEKECVQLLLKDPDSWIDKMPLITRAFTKFNRLNSNYSGFF